MIMTFNTRVSLLPFVYCVAKQKAPQGVHESKKKGEIAV